MEKGGIQKYRKLTLVDGSPNWSVNLLWLYFCRDMDTMAESETDLWLPLSDKFISLYNSGVTRLSRDTWVYILSPWHVWFYILSMSSRVFPCDKELSLGLRD